MQKRLRKIILEELDGISEDDTEAMARYFCGKSSTRTLDEMTGSLISSGFMPRAILSVVLHCERDLMYGLTSEEGGNMVQLSRFLDRFRDFKQAVIAAVRASEMPAEHDSYHQSTVLALCYEYWLARKRISVCNYFREMPVATSTRCISAGGIHLELEVTPEVERVLAVSNNMHDMLAVSPDERYVVHLGAIDYRDGVLSLVVRGLEAAKRERRDELRIEAEHECEVQIKLLGTPYPMRLRDISNGGIGLYAETQIDVQVGDAVDCACQLGDQLVRLHSQVRWYDPVQKRLGLKHESLGAYSEPVQQFLLAEQRKLIDRLRTLSAPVWMRGG